MSPTCGNDGCNKPSRGDEFCSTECFREAFAATPPAIDLVGDAPEISEEVDLVADAPALDPLEGLRLPGETALRCMRRIRDEQDRERLKALHGPRWSKVIAEMETVLRKMGEPEEVAS